MVVIACVVAVLLMSFRLWGGRRSAGEGLAAEPASPPDSRPGIPRSEDLLDLIDEGLLILDRSLTAIQANRSARALLGTGDALPARLPSDDLMSIARRVLVDHVPVDEVVELRSPDRRSLRVRAIYTETSDGVILLLRDISEDQRSQRIRRQFVTHASHELKTPIAAMQLLAEAIGNSSEDDPESTRRFAAGLLQEAQRLNALVTDLLDLSRLEDPGTIANSLADLSAVASSEVLEAKSKAEAKEITLHATVEAGVTVRGDDGQLALMMRNLLDNAVRYTPPAEEISLEVKAERGEAIVRVADTGTGIPLRDQARVFERFYRVDEGRSRDQGGTGLGLAIVKHVADLHGGHVSLSSQLGEGSTFTIVLPLAHHRDTRGAEGAKETA
jgi:two-component system, OmpR family, sensor histidine kinase SenX3